MASNTPNLNLYKKDPIIDGNDTFNITTMLNENWDKIDNASADTLNKIGSLSNLNTTDKSNLVNAINENEGRIDTLETEVTQNVTKLSIPLSNSSPVYSFTAKRAGGIDIQVNGEMVVNLLGMDGDCEDLTKWTNTSGSGLITEDSTIKKYGSKSFKYTGNNTSNQVREKQMSVVDGKYYLVTGEHYIQTTGTGNFAIRLGKTSAATYIIDDVSQVDRGITGIWKRTGLKIAVDSTYENILSIKLIANIGTVVENIDGIMLIEITQDEYTNLTVDQLLAKYPSGNSVRPLMNPTYEVCGKNLWDNSRLKGYTGTILTKTEDGYSVDYTSQTGFVGVPVWLDAKTYTISMTHNIPDTQAIVIRTWEKESDIGGANYITTTQLTSPATSVSFIIPKDGLYYLTFQRTASGNPTGVVTYSDIQLEEGDTATTYEPYKGGQIIFPTELRKIGTYQDKSEYKNGKLEVDRNTLKKVLDGSLGWAFYLDDTGFKKVKIDSLLSNHVVTTNNLFQKYDGAILTYVTSTGSINAKDIGYINASGQIIISLPDTETGWGESYTPTVAEIQAFFNLWRMNNGVYGTPYNGTGTKTWIPIGDTDNARAVTTVPTTVSPSLAEGKAKHYELYYALATPIEEEIEPIILGDGFNVVEGINTIVAKSGYVYDKASPTFLTDSYYINGNSTTPNKLTKLTSKILGVYKNKVRDNDWTITQHASLNWLIYGKEFATIPSSKYDPSAEYYVLYEALPEEYNCQVQLPTAYIEDNLRGSVQEVVETLANIQSDVSILQNQVALLILNSI